MMTRGFTLVETLIAIAVLTIAITGPYTLVQGVLQTSYNARDQLIATALAEEGIEYVREVRDSNFVYTTHHATTIPWLQGLDGTSGPDCYGNYCRVDVANQSAVACGAQPTSCSIYPLYLSATNIYNQALSGTQTKYTRSVHLTQISSTETLVTVTVSWTSHGTQSVTLTENLQKWL